MASNPPPFNDYAFSTFGGLDTSSDATAVADQDFPWIFDTMPVGNGFLIVLKGPSKIASGLGACAWLSYANLNGVDYVIHCDTAGNLNQINLATGAVTQITTGLNPNASDVAVWADTQLLIVDSAKGYGTWNGSAYTQQSATMTGVSIAVHAGRVWIASGRTLTFSAPASYTDFTTGSGGGSSPMNDSTLSGNIVAIREYESLLYIIGVSSVNVIGDLTVPSGQTAPVYTNSNLQASVGSPYIRGVADLQRVIILPSSAGIYGVYGVSAPKLSDPLNGILSMFATIGGQLHSAIGNVENQLAYAFLGNLSHPNHSGASLAVLVGKRWFLSDQGNLSAISTAYRSGVPVMVGADSSSVYTLFTNPSAKMQSRVDTKLFAPKSAVFDHEVIRAGMLVDWASFDTVGMSIITDNGSESEPAAFSDEILFVGSDTALVFFTGSDSNEFHFTRSFGAGVVKAGFSIRGKHVGMSVTLTSPGNVVRAFLMRIRQATAW